MHHQLCPLGRTNRPGSFQVIPTDPGIEPLSPCKGGQQHWKSDVSGSEKGWWRSSPFEGSQCKGAIRVVLSKFEDFDELEVRGRRREDEA